MSRSKDSGGGVLVAVLILLGLGWFALTWPYHVGGWFLEITYLIWLIYMGAMLAWYRHGPALAAPRPPVPRLNREHSRTVIDPRRAKPTHPAAPEPGPKRHPDLAIRLADLPPHGIGPVLLDRLAAAGIRTYADYTGHRIDHSGARATAYLIRSDGAAVQVQGIGPDKAATMDIWRTAVSEGNMTSPR